MIMGFRIFVMSLLLLQSPFQPRFQAVAAPISPADYQNIIEQGFSTNYFKGWPPLRKYNDANIHDVYNKGFRNLRLRCRADLDNYTPPYASNQDFDTFLTDLARVVDKCLEVGVVPIISWVHHEAEANATDQHRQDYIAWWTAVATKLKDRDHKLSFNLFTELGKDTCQFTDCSQSLRENTKKYNEWTAQVITAIRNTGGNNINRILILASPKKTAIGLTDIDSAILTSDQYLMAEWHLYASGPNKKVGSEKHWEGDGNKVGKENVDNAIQPALDFTAATGIKTYFGAWMPMSLNNGGFTEYEVKKFARYLVKQMKEANIPWSLNVLDQYYDTKDMRWRDEQQNITGQLLYLDKVLNTIINNM